MDGTARFDFTGRTIFITGGGSGIGAGMAAAFAKANADVIIGGRRQGPLAAMVERFPDRISYVQMDVGRDDDRRRTIDAILARTGRLDVLINNALSVNMGPIAQVPLQKIQKMYDTLLIAPTALIQLAIPLLIETKGSVINISSVGGRAIPYPPEGLSVYSTAKAGLNHLTRTLANGLGAQGVRLNAIAPGPTSSASSDGAPNPLQMYVDQTPLGRLGHPDDIATVALFLSSDAASWVTGQIIDASGGWKISP
jgi:NAD(P)-dependent dehydrogenase (short-subunit alcohol dehydrogenase family)